MNSCFSIQISLCIALLFYYQCIEWPKCHHSCCRAEPRKSDLELMARYVNEVEAVQHVHFTSIPVWFGLLGDVKDGCT